MAKYRCIFYMLLMGLLLVSASADAGSRDDRQKMQEQRDYPNQLRKTEAIFDKLGINFGFGFSPSLPVQRWMVANKTNVVDFLQQRQLTGINDSDFAGRDALGVPSDVYRSTRENRLKEYFKWIVRVERIQVKENQKLRAAGALYEIEFVASSLAIEQIKQAAKFFLKNTKALNALSKQYNTTKYVVTTIPEHVIMGRAQERKSTCASLPLEKKLTCPVEFELVVQPSELSETKIRGLSDTKITGLSYRYKDTRFFIENIPLDTPHAWSDYVDLMVALDQDPIYRELKRQQYVQGIRIDYDGYTAELYDGDLLLPRNLSYDLRALLEGANKKQKERRDAYRKARPKPKHNIAGFDKFKTDLGWVMLYIRKFTAKHPKYQTSTMFISYDFDQHCQTHHCFGELLGIDCAKIDLEQVGEEAKDCSIVDMDEQIDAVGEFDYILQDASNIFNASEKVEVNRQLKVIREKYYNGSLAAYLLAEQLVTYFRNRILGGELGDSVEGSIYSAYLRRSVSSQDDYSVFDQAVLAAMKKRTTRFRSFIKKLMTYLGKQGINQDLVPEFEPLMDELTPLMEAATELVKKCIDQHRPALERSPVVSRKAYLKKRFSGC